MNKSIVFYFFIFIFNFSCAKKETNKTQNLDQNSKGETPSIVEKDTVVITTAPKLIDLNFGNTILNQRSIEKIDSLIELKEGKVEYFAKTYLDSTFTRYTKKEDVPNYDHLYIFWNYRGNTHFAIELFNDESGDTEIQYQYYFNKKKETIKHIAQAKYFNCLAKDDLTMETIITDFDLNTSSVSSDTTFENFEDSKAVKNDCINPLSFDFTIESNSTSMYSKIRG